MSQVCSQCEGKSVYVIVRVYTGPEVWEQSTTHGVFTSYGAARKKFNEFIENEGLAGERRTEREFYGEDAAGNVVLLKLNEHTILPHWIFGDS